MRHALSEGYKRYNNLLEVAGATLLRMSLMIYSGRELIATITATFQIKGTDVTKARSEDAEFKPYGDCR